MKCFKTKWGGIGYNLTYIHPLKGSGIKFYKLLNLWTIFTWQQKLTKPLHRTHKTPGCLIRQKFYFKKSTFLFLDAPLNSKANS